MNEFFISCNNRKKMIKEVNPGKMIFRDFFKKNRCMKLKKGAFVRSAFFNSRNLNILKSARIERRTGKNEQSDETFYID